MPRLVSSARALTLVACLAGPFAPGCRSSTQLANETAPRTKLSAYPSAILEIVAPELTADARADLAHELEAQLSDSKLFTRLGTHAARATAEATLRVTLLSIARDQDVTVRFRVELLEPRRAAPLVARFDVAADSERTGIREGGGAAYDFDDKAEHATEKAVRAIVAKLDGYANDQDNR